MVDDTNIPDDTKGLTEYSAQDIFTLLARAGKPIAVVLVAVMVLTAAVVTVLTGGIGAVLNDSNQGVAQAAQYTNDTGTVTVTQNSTNASMYDIAFTGEVTTNSSDTSELRINVSGGEFNAPSSDNVNLEIYNDTTNNSVTVDSTRIEDNGTQLVITYTATTAMDGATIEADIDNSLDWQTQDGTITFASSFNEEFYSTTIQPLVFSDPDTIAQVGDVKNDAGDILNGTFNVSQDGQTYTDTSNGTFNTETGYGFVLHESDVDTSAPLNVTFSSDGYETETFAANSTPSADFTVLNYTLTESTTESQYYPISNITTSDGVDAANVSNATVTVSDGENVVDTANMGSGDVVGDYNVTLTDGVEYVVTVEADDYSTEGFNYTAGQTDAQSLTLNAAQTKTLNVTNSDGTDVTDGDVFVVEFTQDGANDRFLGLRQYAVSNGTADITYYDDYTVRLQAASPNSDMVYDNFIGYDEEIPDTISLTQENHNVTVNVEDNNGNAIDTGEVTLNVRNEYVNPFASESANITNGSAVITDDVIGGDYELVIDGVTNYQNITTDITVDSDETINATLYPTDDADNDSVITSNTAQAEYTVSGQVSHYNDSVDVGGVTVELVQNDTVVYNTTTDADGNYSIDGVVDGDYTVRTSEVNNETVSGEITVNGSDVTADLAFESATGGLIGDWSLSSIINGFIDWVQGVVDSILSPLGGISDTWDDITNVWDDAVNFVDTVVQDIQDLVNYQPAA